MTATAPKKLASRQDLIARLARRFGTFDLPGSGLCVRYQSLSEAELADFEMDFLVESEDGAGLRQDPEQLRRARARLIVLCLVDAEGRRLLEDGDIEIVHLHFDAADSAPLYDRLREHCGIARRVRDAQQAREEKKTGSSATNGCVSSSGSAPTSAASP